MRGRDAKHISQALFFGLFGGGRGEHKLHEETWHAVLDLPLFDGLDAGERARLHELTLHVLADKAFSGAGGIKVDDGMATAIAAFAGLPALNIGYAGYEGWCEIVVYPGEFIHDGEQMDEDGVVHHVRDVRSGEAMQGGPMVLSWKDVEHSGQGEGFNVVIHEFAHKLDMKNGDANGRPPLHSGMSPVEWAREFRSAYDDLCRRVERGEDTVIDPYATENPAEFFAVLTEYFFEAPDLLKQEYPAVYGLLARYFRQDPLARMQVAAMGR
jgi:Mlc titration factor MtfA (ptsG expression regulator)